MYCVCTQHQTLIIVLFVRKLRLQSNNDSIIQKISEFGGVFLALSLVSRAQDPLQWNCF